MSKKFNFEFKNFLYFKRKIILLNMIEMREQEPKREHFNHLKEQISYESFFFSHKSNTDI
jgi:hypothetical protein